MSTSSKFEVHSAREERNAWRRTRVREYLEAVFASQDEAERYAEELARSFPNDHYLVRDVSGAKDGDAGAVVWRRLPAPLVVNAAEVSRCDGRKR